MARDATGNYASPSSNFSAGTTINANTMNGKLTDLGDEITNSLDRSGRGAMVAPLILPNGTSSAPALAFTNDVTIGAHLVAAGDLRFSDSGTNILGLTATRVRSYVPLSISTGGVTIDAGGLTVTAGGGTISAGGLSVIGTTPAASGVTGASTLEASGALSTTTSESHALTTLAKAVTAGPNTIRLNARTLNDSSGTIASWADVGLGLSYDVDSTVGSGGSLYFGNTGARLTSGTAATAADPANALELVNGHLKLSGEAPNADEDVPNTLTPMLIPKAVARITTDGVGGAVLTGRSANIASVAINGTDLRVTFASDFTDANFIAIANSTLSAVTPNGYNTAAGVSRVDITRVGGGSMNNAGETTILAFGLQA